MKSVVLLDQLHLRECARVGEVEVTSAGEPTVIGDIEEVMSGSPMVLVMAEPEMMPAVALCLIMPRWWYLRKW